MLPDPRLRVFGLIVDALILAGGRSTRLGDSDKQKLVLPRGVSVLERAVDAVRSVGARSIVLVGDDGMDGVVTVRENPPFGGPVAAIAVGSASLPSDSDLVLLLACDMPGIGDALPLLLSGVQGEGSIAVDRGRRQQLAFAVRRDALARALASHPEHAGASVRSLLEHLDLTEVAVPDGSTDDIDTWEDAARFGILPPTPMGAPA